MHRNDVQDLVGDDGADKILRELVQPDCAIRKACRGAIQALHRMKHDIPDCPPIIFLTCALTEELKRNALALGAEACFDKSKVEGPELVDAIITAVKGKEV